MTSRQSDIESLVAEAERAGWRVKRTRRHYRLYPADRDHRPITVSITPRSDKVLTAIRADLRRAGLEV